MSNRKHQSKPRAKRKTSKSPTFDPAIYKSLDAKIKATAPQRAKLEREWKQERDHRRSIERAYDLLMIIGNGTKEQPISTQGRVVIPTRTWAAQIQKTAKELIRCVGPYKQGNLPTFIAPYRTEGEGHVVGRTALDLALRGASLDDITASLDEGLARLRQLHAEGVPANIRDSECGVEDYYSNLWRAFMHRSDELWVEDQAALDLVIHLGRLPDGSIGRLNQPSRSTSTSHAATPAPVPSVLKAPRDVLADAKVLGDCGQCMITNVAFRRFVEVDIDPTHLASTKSRMPDPVWVAPRMWPWYRVSDLIAVYQLVTDTKLGLLSLNSKIRKKLMQPDAVPPWHEQATRRPSSDPST